MRQAVLKQERSCRASQPVLCLGGSARLCWAGGGGVPQCLVGGGSAPWGLEPLAFTLSASGGQAPSAVQKGPLYIEFLNSAF